MRQESLDVVAGAEATREAGRALCLQKLQWRDHARGGAVSAWHIELRHVQMLRKCVRARVCSPSVEKECPSECPSEFVRGY